MHYHHQHPITSAMPSPTTWITLCSTIIEDIDVFSILLKAGEGSTYSSGVRCCGKISQFIWETKNHDK